MFRKIRQFSTIPERVVVAAMKAQQTDRVTQPRNKVANKMIVAFTAANTETLGNSFRHKRLAKGAAHEVHDTKMAASTRPNYSITDLTSMMLPTSSSSNPKLSSFLCHWERDLQRPT